MSNKIRLPLFITIFLLIFVFVVEPLNHINSSVEGYVKKYTNADVLVIGSSHAYCNLNSAILWHDYGITAAFIGQGEQPLSYSYYSLKSALRYAKPKLVILEAYMVATGEDTSYDTAPGQYINALLGFPIYKNLDCRIEAVKNVDVKYKLPYVVGFPNWERSYNLYDGYDSVGCQYLTGFNPDDQWNEFCSTGMINQYGDISDYSEEYLLKISDLCKKNDIPFLCLITPYQMSSDHAARINTARKLADENNIDFIDMNDYISETTIDLSTEMVNWGHTLITVSDKASRWLGPVLQEKYGILDRRGDSDYSFWEDCYKYYLEKKQTGISSSDLETCLRIVSNDDVLDYYIAMTPYAQKRLKEDSSILQFLPSDIEKLMGDCQSDLFLFCGDETKACTDDFILKEELLPAYDVAVIAVDKFTGEPLAGNYQKLNFEK